MAQRITARLHLLANRPRYLVFFFSLFPFSLPRLQLSFLIFVFFSYFTLLFSFPHNPLPKGYAFSKPSLTSSIDYGTYTRRAVTHKKHKNIPGDVTTTYVCLRTLKNTSLITGQAYLAILKPKKLFLQLQMEKLKSEEKWKWNWTKEIGICQCCQMAALWMLFVKGDPLWRRLKSQWCVHILEFLSSAIDNISHMHSRTMDFDWTWFRSKSIYLFYINIPNRAIVK